jgi:hypothetical protein
MWCEGGAQLTILIVPAALAGPAASMAISDAAPRSFAIFMGLHPPQSVFSCLGLIIPSVLSRLMKLGYAAECPSPIHWK